MLDPFLFQSAGLAEAVNSADAFASRALLRFGECASRLQAGYSEWPIISNSHKVWRNALAAEALLFPPAYRMNNPPFAGFVTDDARPCGAEAPSYGELKAYPAAAALFPMSGDRPRAGRIWAVGTGTDEQLPPERTFSLEEAEGILREASKRNIRLYAEGCEMCDGESWQLAAHLAMDSLEAGDLEYSITLAAEWLVTGKVYDGRVQRVDIKNKTELGYSAHRRWLVPEPSLDAFHRSAGRSGLTEPPVTAVRALTDAIEAVRGCVSRRRPNEPWPREVACLHVAVAADPSPVLRLLELLRTRELHLWALGSHQETVAGLRETLRRRFSGVMVHVRESLTPDDLEAMSCALHAVFNTNPQPYGLLFDISAGSWLFRVAVEGVARRLGFPVLCQDCDARPYVKLWHERAVPCYCQMTQGHAALGYRRKPPAIVTCTTKER